MQQGWQEALLQLRVLRAVTVMLSSHGDPLAWLSHGVGTRRLSHMASSTSFTDASCPSTASISSRTCMHM